MRKKNINKYLYPIGIGVLIIGLGVLLWLRHQIAADMARAVTYSKSLFPKDSVLKAPDDLMISFTQIETLANISKSNNYIDDIVVTKFLAGKGEISVFPFWKSSLFPDWKNSLKNMRKEKLTHNETVYGFIYLKLNKSALSSATFAVTSYVVLLGLVIIGGLSRLRSQEIFLTKTTVELEDRKKELIRLERLALAGKLMANILHDIKKPVLNIKNEVPALKQSLENKQKTNEGLDIIREQADFFFSILNDVNMERFVTAEDTEKEYANINSCIEQSLRLVSYERGATQVETNFAPDLPNILAYRYRLIQVFSNIILNAYQAMASKGRLSILTEKDDGRVKIVLSDSGPGISDEDIPHLFEPFFTSGKEEGAGLGLYITSSIIEEMGGTIEVKSETSKGTAFIIRI